MSRHTTNDLRSGSRVVRAEEPDERMTARHLLSALALHVAALCGALLLPGLDAAPDQTITVDLVLQDGGEAGASGGAADAAEIGGTPDAQPAPETTQQAAVTAPAVQPPQPKPQPKPLPRPAKAQPKAEPKAAPPAEPEFAPPPPATAPSVANSAGAPAGAIGRGQGGPAGIGHGTEGTGAGAFGSGEGPGDEYFERLRRWLAKYKDYPDAALKQKQQGTVTVEFMLARDGTVLDAQIERSSGFPILDRATLEMLRRASPVPPLPERYTGERIKIAMPIDYKIGLFGRLF
jgi:periplasmic protein TonB